MVKAKTKTTRKKTLKKAAAKGRSAVTARGKGVAYKSLADVRREIDDLDAVIVPLLCWRHYLVIQAAQFKFSVKGVVVTSRAEAIISRARRAAKAGGANPDAIEVVYRSMIDAFTKDEQRHWRKIHKP